MSDAIFSGLESIAELVDGADFRKFVLARAVQLAKEQNNPQVAIKALELIAKLALDVSLPSGDRSIDDALAGLTDEQRAEAVGVATRIIEMVGENGSDSSHS